MNQFVELRLDGLLPEHMQGRNVNPGDYLGQIMVINRASHPLERVEVIDETQRMDVLFSSVRDGDGVRERLRLGTILPGGRAVCHARLCKQAIEGRLQVRIDALAPVEAVTA
jgi:hypothetical protein